LLRGTAPVLVVLFVVPLVVEPVLTGLSQLPTAPEWLHGAARWLPFTAGRALALTGGGNAEHLSPAQGGVLFAGLVAVAVLAGGVRLARSDA
jgi:ABC-2 type transport system permease protein